VKNNDTDWIFNKNVFKDVYPKLDSYLSSVSFWRVNIVVEETMCWAVHEAVCDTLCDAPYEDYPTEWESWVEKAMNMALCSL
jgi:hypothetical protein